MYKKSLLKLGMCSKNDRCVQRRCEQVDQKLYRYSKRQVHPARLWLRFQNCKKIERYTFLRFAINILRQICDQIACIGRDIRA